MIRLRKGKAVQRPWSRPPAVECLESRTLLAGNVITTPTGTPTSPGEPAPELLIEGDSLDNEIMIKKGNAPGEIIVNGLNGTLVNGSTQEWHYNGVQFLQALMDGGIDKVDLRNLTLSGVPDSMSGFASTAQVLVDGGAGDDHITMFNTTIDASAPAPDPDNLFFPTASAGVFIYGETSQFGDLSGTGNDFIEVSNTTITADGGFVTGSNLQIFGDENAGGTITGGNDHINVSNTEIRATNSSFLNDAAAAIIIYGDDNSADTGSTSVIGQGNDWINVNNTDIVTDGALGSALAFVQVFGDNNFASAGGSATIGNFAAKTGGNDTISLTNMTVSASGANLLSSVGVDVRGDQNSSDAGVADIGGGNDTISIRNFAAGAPGLFSTNMTDLNVFGDGASASVTVTSRIGGGNDVISLTNDDIFASGNPNNVATALIFTDDFTQATGLTVGQGNDDVTIANFLLSASTSSNVQLQTQKGRDIIDIHNTRVGGLGINTGTGDDELDILNSRWTTGNFDLDAGNDVLKMNGNTFVMTNANGGLGIDRLSARNNSGILVPLSFEILA